MCGLVLPLHLQLDGDASRRQTILVCWIHLYGLLEFTHIRQEILPLRDLWLLFNWLFGRGNTGADFTEAFSSLDSISVSGRGGGISGATSRKSQGSSSSEPLWLAPKKATKSSQNFLVLVPARAIVRLCRASLRSKLALALRSADTRKR